MNKLKPIIASASILSLDTNTMNNRKIINSLCLFFFMSFLLVSFSVFAGTASKKVTYVDNVKSIEEMHINRMMGMDVVNKNGEKLGKISNLIWSPKPDSVLFAIISVGGFFGIDSKLVAVPVDNLTFKDNTAILDASKQEIKEAPEFKYTPGMASDIANPPE